MEIRIQLEGTTPLLMHNPRMVDPEYPLVREIAAITSKRKKTDDDRARIETLEWFGGLYDDGERVVLPAANIRKCLIETGRINKLGKHVERSLVTTSLFEPLLHDGPQDPKEIYATGNGFVSKLAAGIGGKKRIMRVRPKFIPWRLDVPLIFLEDAGLNFDELERIVELAGRATGLGDGRAIGYGRFVGTVVRA